MDLKMPKVEPFSFNDGSTSKTFLVLDEGKGNHLLHKTFLVEGNDEDGYRILKKVFKDLEMDPIPTKDEALRKTVNIMYSEWSNEI